MPSIVEQRAQRRYDALSEMPPNLRGVADRARALRINSQLRQVALVSAHKRDRVVARFVRTLENLALPVMQKLVPALERTGVLERFAEQLVRTRSALRLPKDRPTALNRRVAQEIQEYLAQTHRVCQDRRDIRGARNRQLVAVLLRQRTNGLGNFLEHGR